MVYHSSVKFVYVGDFARSGWLRKIQQETLLIETDPTLLLQQLCFTFCTMNSPNHSPNVQESYEGQIRNNRE